MAKAIVTRHQQREAVREAALADEARRAALGAWRHLMGRPLTHAIRLALDVSLTRETAWIESCRDTQGETLLAQLRGRLAELKPSDWTRLREQAPHVWRVLVLARPFAVQPRT